MDKLFFDVPVAAGVHCVRLSIGVIATFLREGAKWLQAVRDTEELLLAASKPNSGGLSVTETARHFRALRNIPHRH